MALYFWIAAVLLVIFLSGIRIVRPTHRGLIERLGRYNRFARPGFSWVMPVI
jgi:regulator of protease activity HflC (stomatin/prohibitin superfamily)